MVVEEDKRGRGTTPRVMTPTPPGARPNVPVPIVRGPGTPFVRIEIGGHGGWLKVDKEYLQVFDAF